MLKDNIKIIRKQKELSQEELSIKLNVVRQTISKWEQGLSVPDAEMLMSISNVLETPVSTLLGETVEEEQTNNIKEISQKLESINLELVKEKERKRKIWHYSFTIISIIFVLIYLLLYSLGNTYMEWNYQDPELAILGVGIHSFIWIFMRISPFIIIGLIFGFFLTRKKQ